MKRILHLEYAQPTGRLAPHFEALDRGHALARRCGGCGHVAFPPSLTCGTCGARDGAWVALSGRAALIQRSDTPDAAYALVRFDGAGNAAMVRLKNPEITTQRGALLPPENEAGLWLELEEPRNDD
ncbi:Zn-ribbon domain-containing OB-fold protein [Paracoccus seriniphilus]|uniref:ChsH2 rubredoxin-like zinc ribbon domain-containing protein n=1 Tax=Paracoccus seriniphilus TaxID=184748 RepID=A0A239PZI5_9RHOB|nr:zinc ribbon domain-containing protein [Paracoccus seriniphilus]WCR15659.1 hypothetical protein JHW44_14185 [Paracoccus seriniphilus]SNT75665.1 hypothetical protein SAMN05444959_11286 [Paracoccus seriniphilus]